MSTRAFSIGIESFSKKLVDFLGDTIKAMQIDLTQVDTCVKAITGATNASPIVVTATAHGYANGDIVVQRGIVGNLAANGTFKIANQATNTYELQNLDGANTTGSGAYTSGGTSLNLTKPTALADLNAGRNGTDQTLGSKTDVGGLLNCAAFTFVGVAGNVDGLVIYKDNGSDATSVPLFFIDGKMLLRVAADAAGSATSLWVERLAGPLATALAPVFSNGVTATVNGAVAQFARLITVTALPGAIAAGHTADAATTGAGLPFTGGGGSYTYTPDTAANKLFNLNAI